MDKPTLIYDADCNFCQYCVNYLKLKTNKKINFEGYQTNSHGLKKEDLAQSIHLIVSDKEIYKGAAASFKILTYGGNNMGWWCYQNIPGVSWVSEKKYRWITKHRSFCFKIAKLLCGNPWQLWRLPFTILSIITILLLLLLLID